MSGIYRGIDEHPQVYLNRIRDRLRQNRIRPGDRHIVDAFVAGAKELIEVKRKIDELMIRPPNQVEQRIAEVEANLPSDSITLADETLQIHAESIGVHFRINSDTLAKWALAISVTDGRSLDKECLQEAAQLVLYKCP